jgi:RNA polymerase sigma factor (sigma-70 family)
MGLTYADLFADWEIGIAKKVIIHFQIGLPWLKGLDFDDLLQECLIHWYLNRAKFQKDRGATIETFMAKVLGTRLQMILREQLTDKRKTFYMTESLEKPMGEDETPLLDTIPDDAHRTDLSLHLDIELVLMRLTPLQRDICNLLGQEYAVKKIAEMLGKPRTTVRDEIKRIREIFSRKGLEEYLK